MKTTVAANMFLTSRKAKGLSGETLRWYGVILALFAARYPDLPKKPEDLEAFIAGCAGGDERRHGYFRTLRAFYRFLDRRQGVRNPVAVIDPPRRQHKERRFLSPAELARLLTFPHEPDIRAALLCLADTGCRLSEMATLTIDQLHDTGVSWSITVHGKTGTRTVPICYEVYHELMVRLPFQITPDWMARKIKLAFEAAGVPGSAITLRHTFGSLWEGDPFVLQRILGHSTPATTAIYRHMKPGFVEKEHGKHSPLTLIHYQGVLW